LGEGRRRTHEEASQNQRQNGENTRKKHRGTAQTGLRKEHDFADGLELPYHYGMILNGP
jgi:hypothetical protein